MKKQAITLVVLAGMVMGASVAYGAAGSAGGGIVGSKHDMNVWLKGTGANAGAVDKENRVCAYCHTPHHAQGISDTGAFTVTIDDPTDTNPTVPGGHTAKKLSYNVYSPLWSRTIDMTKGYASYRSATFDPQTQGYAYDNLIGPSRLCMTCHDGQIAADSYYGQTGNGSTGTSTFLGGDELLAWSTGNIAVGLTNGLSNDHPIGMRYSDYNKAPYELNVTTTVFGTTGKTIANVLYSDATSPDPVADFVTCASCHDVHNGNDVGNKTNLQTAGRGYFLRATQKDSAFCLTCHNKNS